MSAFKTPLEGFQRQRVGRWLVGQLVYFVCRVNPHCHLKKRQDLVAESVQDTKVSSSSSSTSITGDAKRGTVGIQTRYVFVVSRITDRPTDRLILPATAAAFSTHPSYPGTIKMELYC